MGLIGDFKMANGGGAGGTTTALATRETAPAELGLQLPLLRDRHFCLVAPLKNLPPTRLRKS